MPEIFLLFALYMLLQRYIDRPNVKRIKKCSSVIEINAIRKQIKKNRYKTFVVYMAFYIIVAIIVCSNNDGFYQDRYMAIKSFVMGGFGIVVYMFMFNKYGELFGNISTLTKVEYLEKHKKYALFLRGFQQDDYHHDAHFTRIEGGKFSEFEFTMLLQKSIATCAVGMSKEVDSPRGAERLYLDDSTWKNDVRELMDRAERIYILVDDRESCIWEIEQSASMLEKTVFIVDDIKKYQNVCSNMIDKVIFPDISADIKNDNQLVVLMFENGTFNTSVYENTIKGYAMYLHQPVPSKRQIRRARKKKITLRQWILNCLWAFILSVLLTAAYYVYIVYTENMEEIYSIERITENLEEINNEYPLKIDYYTTIDSVQYVNNNMVYYCSVDDSSIELESISEKFKIDKNRTLNPSEKYFYTILVRNNCGIIYLFYGKCSKKILSCTYATYEEINEVLEKQQDE